MYETVDLTGRQIGDLKVLRLHKKSRNGGASWLCRCSCGRLCSVGGCALLQERIKKCNECNYGRYYFYPDYVECRLPKGNSFQIDYEDYPLVAKYRWVVNQHGYFVASLGKGENHIFLHRLLMNPPEGMFVDHVDGNKGNCRRNNLRFCTKTENNRNVGLQKNNQCGLKGVYWAADRKKWRAEITVGRKHIHLGSFDSSIEAAEAYDQAAASYFGEFAKTNKMIGSSQLHNQKEVHSEEVLELDPGRQWRQGAAPGGPH